MEDAHIKNALLQKKKKTVFSGFFILPYNSRTGVLGVFLGIYFNKTVVFVHVL